MAASPNACYGCDASGFHPWSAVMNTADVAADYPDAQSAELATNGPWVAVPVCAACHRDPAHRGRLIKAHFFPAADEKLALRLAGSNTLGNHR